MAVFVVHGKKRKKFRTARGARWHKTRFGGRIVKGKPKRRKSPKRRRKSSRRRR
jgi:hypothetical protein